MNKGALEVQALRGFGDAGEVRYYSLARHALVAALRTIDIKPGQSVLFPEYICRDLLAAVYAVGARAVFYPVAADLSPATPQEYWPHAAAVLAVDYFGFPQSLDIFQAFCQRTGAVLIEDNAHGFLSCDEAGQLLGSRGDIGILSMRKTFPLPNGAALVVLRKDLAAKLPPQCSFEGKGGRAGLRVKTILRRLPVLGAVCNAGVTYLARGLRKLFTGYAIPPPAKDAETHIPVPENPYAGLLDGLQACNIENEVMRRRTLYQDFAALFRDWNIEPVFSYLPENTAPYGFAFRADDHEAHKVQRVAERHGLDAFRWPDLPDALASNGPEHYRRTWVLNFLW